MFFILLFPKIVIIRDSYETDNMIEPSNYKEITKLYEYYMKTPCESIKQFTKGSSK